MLKSQDAEQKFIDIGAIYLDGYKNVRIPAKFLCPNCNQEFLRRPSRVIKGNILCKKCLGCINKIKTRHNITNQQFNQLTAITDVGKIKNHRKWLCKCSCGNEKIATITQLRKGHIKTCGKCKAPKIGDKKFALTVIEIFYYNNGFKLKCRCDCGKIWIGIASSFINNIKKTCGNCKLYRNGKATSYDALNLQTIIESILNIPCEHNFFIQDVGNIDIVCQKLKLVIEYDTYYWHRIKQNTSKKERLKDKILNKNGWKILRIRSQYKIPSYNIIQNAIKKLLYTSKTKIIITTNEWHKNVKKYKVK